MRNYFTIPQDVLFFRDARPMTANTGSGGHGARWPEPSVIFDTIHAALHRAFPMSADSSRDATTFQDYLKEQQWDWQHPHRYVARPQNGRSRNRQPEERFRNQRFGSLKTFGPFPAIRGTGSEAHDLWLFPAPADYLSNETAARPFLSPFRQSCGNANLPGPFLHALGSPCEPSKTEAAPWWSKAAIEAAMRNEPPPRDGCWQKSELYAEEWNIGIGIDPARQTQDEKRIYAAQYMRLREEVALGFTASLPTNPPNGVDGIQHLFPANDIIICGGQQRACRVKELKDEAQAPVALKDLLPLAQLNGFQPDRDGKWRIKWMLLSPAVFPFVSEASPGGWLPNWIAALDGEDHGRPYKAGHILLKPQIPPQGVGEGRETWRKRIAREVAPIGARLVAARVPKPVVVSGWSERLHILVHAANLQAETSSDYTPDKGARPTLIAVPAGSVYYFEADTEPDARALTAALNWHGADTNPTTIKNRRSTLLGEKGFGLGVCGTWTFLEDVAGRSVNRNL